MYTLLTAYVLDFSHASVCVCVCVCVCLFLSESVSHAVYSGDSLTDFSTIECYMCMCLTNFIMITLCEFKPMK